MVLGDEEVGLLPGEEIIVGLADVFAAVNAQQLLAGAVDEDEAKIRRRLESARRELARAGEFHYQIINQDLDKTTAELRAIVAGLLARTRDAG